MKLSGQKILVATLLVLGMNSAQAVEGYKLYQETCAKCHGESGHADNFRGYLYFARNFNSKEWQQKMSDADILQRINQGARMMPSYEKSLSDEQKSALIRVIREFGRN